MHCSCKNKNSIRSRRSTHKPTGTYKHHDMYHLCVYWHMGRTHVGKGGRLCPNSGILANQQISSTKCMFRKTRWKRRPILESAIVLLVVVHMVVRSADAEVVVLLLVEVDIPS